MSKVFLCLMFLASLYMISNGQTLKKEESKEKLIAEIDSILQSQVDRDKIPGAVILIKKDSQIIYRQAFGFAQKYDFNHQKLNPPEKMSAEHLFDIASLTKVIGTATSIMLLVDKGLVNVDDPVGKYIKDFNTPEKKNITLRNLLTHTSGLCEWYPLYYRSANKEECYRLISELPLKYQIGKGHHYSDLGYIILGEIIETVSGLTLEQFMKQNIFVPLAMNNTTYNPLLGNFKKIAATSPGNPYEKRMVYDSILGFKFKEIDPDQWNGWRKYMLKGEVNDGNTWYANGGISGAAGLFSTIDDLQKLLDMLINNGKVGPIQFISEKTLNAFFTKDKFKNGLGWIMDTNNSIMKNSPDGTFGHTGFTGTSIVVIPKYKASVILLINRQNMGLINNKEYYGLNSLRQQIFKSVLDYCK